MARPKSVVVDRDSIAKRLFKQRIAAKNGGSPAAFPKADLESGVGDSVNLDGGEEDEIAKFLDKQGETPEQAQAVTQPKLTKLVIPKGLEEGQGDAGDGERNKKPGDPPHDFVFNAVQDFLNKGVPVQTAAILVLAEAVLELAIVHRDKR